MDAYFVALGSAIWLGMLTSVSPCPLATNIAAVTYIGKRVDRPLTVVLSGLVYTLGRTVGYVGLAALIVSSALAVPALARFLQKYMNLILGPVLILVGLFLLGVVRPQLPVFGVSERVAGRLERLGVWGAGLLGLLFALSFCPVSAALYFGSLIPIAVEHSSVIVMPTMYGIGSALPVIGFSVLIAFSARSVGVAFHRLTVFALWAGKITGVVFILIGIYYCLVYFFGVDILMQG